MVPQQRRPIRAAGSSAQGARLGLIPGVCGLAALPLTPTNFSIDLKESQAPHPSQAALDKLLQRLAQAPTVFRDRAQVDLVALVRQRFQDEVFDRHTPVQGLITQSLPNRIWHIEL
jgi:hypothetical protein